MSPTPPTPLPLFSAYRHTHKSKEAKRTKTMGSGCAVTCASGSSVQSDDDSGSDSNDSTVGGYVGLGCAGAGVSGSSVQSDDDSGSDSDDSTVGGYESAGDDAERASIPTISVSAWHARALASKISKIVVPHRHAVERRYTVERVYWRILAHVRARAALLCVHQKRIDRMDATVCTGFVRGTEHWNARKEKMLIRS